jgi:hypothetical protein
MTAGKQIIWSGNTGHSSGPHLHLGIRINAVDCPQPLLRAVYGLATPPDPRTLPASGCIAFKGHSSKPLVPLLAARRARRMTCGAAGAGAGQIGGEVYRRSDSTPTAARRAGTGHRSVRNVARALGDHTMGRILRRISMRLRRRRCAGPVRTDRLEPLDLPAGQTGTRERGRLGVAGSAQTKPVTRPGLGNGGLDRRSPSPFIETQRFIRPLSAWRAIPPSALTTMWRTALGRRRNAQSTVARQILGGHTVRSAY